MESKLTKRQLQAKETRQKIYDVAIRLIEQKGFQNITIAEICKEANVSIGSFYNYFQSKNSILDEIFKVADDFFLNTVAKDLTEATTRENIIKYFHYYAFFNTERGIDFIKQLYTVKNNLFATKGRHMQAVLREVIMNGQEKGEITTDMSADEIVDYLFIAVRGGVYHWCLNDGQYDLCDFMDQYVELLLKALL